MHLGRMCQDLDEQGRQCSHRNWQAAERTERGCRSVVGQRWINSKGSDILVLRCAAAAAQAEEDEDGDDDGDAEDGDGHPRPKRKKSARTHTTTLADSFSKIQVKDLELEFTVDPLFKKTSADFDEGGAAGLLMNHLSSDSNMRVVFDAGDAKIDDGCEVEGEEEEDDGLEDDEKLPTLDITKLKGRWCMANES